VLISLSDATLKDTTHGGHVANPDGSDIYFTDSSGSTQYSYEIESYNSSTGTLVAWVKVPSLSSSTDTVLKIWYGGSGGASNNPSDVWDSNFKGVWHMTQVNAPDSTSNSNDGTENAGVSSITGQVDGADNFTRSSSGYIDCGTGSSLNFNAGGSYTWEVWVKPTSLGSGGSGIIGKTISSNSSTVGYEVYIAGTGGVGTKFRFAPGSNGYVQSSANVSTSVWTHLAVVYNGSSDIKLYFNGAQDGSGSLNVSDDTSNALYIGYRRSTPQPSGGGGYFNGIIDEVRFSTTARSADWIKTEYNNQYSPNTFYSVGGEMSSDATLSNLTISAGNLTPPFTSNTTNCTDSVANNVSSVTVTPTANESHATIKVNDITVTSGQASGNISLSLGDNTITIVVTAQDSTTTKTYTITVTRAPSGGGCFIATAAYGTPMAEEIQILRQFRDEYLLTNPVGKGLVEFYYKVSPPMAEFITEHPSLKPIVRAGLVPAVAMSILAVNTSLAEKITIIGLLALVSVALAVWATRRRGRGPQYT